MTLQFTAEGLQIETFEEIFNAAADKYREIYGQGINIDQNAPDGQRLAISTKLAADLQEVLQQVYSGLDADLAGGVFLDIIAKIAGLTRRPATRSSVQVEITTSFPITIPAGYTVSDENGQNWLTTSSFSLPAGTTTVTLFAEFFGAYEAPANTVNEPVTIILGVESVDNPTAATVGEPFETDAEFRRRRARGVENAALSTVGALISSLLNTAGVTDVQVYENKSDQTDLVRDMPPHSIWAVVEGGSVDDIAETMAKNKTMGTVEKGNVTGIYDEEILVTNNRTYTYRNEMNFDRPVISPLYVRLDASVTTGVLDTQAIKEAIAQREYNIGEGAVSSELYGFAYQANTNFVLSNLEISDDDITYVDGIIASGFGEKFDIDTANITITEI